MKRVIIVGSPRTGGRSAHLAEMLFEANIDERPEDELFLVPVSEIEVGPCIGCNACRQKSPVILREDDGSEVTRELNRCIFDDDMQMVYDLVDDADALTVVSPVYFSGAPASLKCLLDRLQPYFWAYTADAPRLPKRPLELHVVGEGGDPHGYDALVSEVRSATLLAGFRIERIYDWVGKISPDGQIEADARVIDLQLAENEASDQEVTSADAAAAAPATAAAAGGAAAVRPKLDLSAPSGAAARGGRSARQGASAKQPGKAAPGQGAKRQEPARQGAPAKRQSPAKQGGSAGLKGKQGASANAKGKQARGGSRSKSSKPKGSRRG